MAAISSHSSFMAFPISTEKAKMSAVDKQASLNPLLIPAIFSYVREFLSLREIFQATVNRSARANTTAVLRAQLPARIRNSLKELRIYQRLLKMEDLSSVLQYCGRVVHLDCSLEKMNDTLLLSLNRYLPNLRSINLRGCRNITSTSYIYFFERNPQLHSIHLDDMEVNDVVLQKLVHFCPDLASISIDYCDEPTHLNVLAHCPKLTSIHISHLYLTDPTTLNIFANLQNLTHVTLPSSCITDSYLRSLTERASKLISVTLANQRFTEVTLCAFIKSCEDLQQLDVQSCHQLTDRVVQVLIAQKLRNLQMVDLSHCSGITECAILELQEQYPNANIIPKVSNRTSFCRLC